MFTKNYCKTFLNFLLISFLSYTGAESKGWTVLLNGTSSAGKSSVCKELRKELKKNIKTISFSFESLDEFNTAREKMESKQKKAHCQNTPKDQIKKNTKSDDDSQEDFFKYIANLAKRKKKRNC